MKPTVALYLPTDMIRQMFRDSDLQRLQQIATVLAPQSSDAPALSHLALGNAQVLITGWGSPAIDQPTLDRAPALRLLAHSAGSAKDLVSDCVFDRGVRLTTAASANAVPVAEFTVAMMVNLLKQLPWIANAYAKADQREIASRLPAIRELANLQVGLVAASRIGRLVVQRLRSYTNITVKLFDPFLTLDQAAKLGVIKSSLAEVCQCQVISVHAPSLPQTRHLISAHMLSLMPDHAVFINTSRGSLVDESALVAELHRRPLYAALDVTDPEPPLADSPLRSAPNLVLTPHIAGAMNQARQDMGKLAIDESIRFLNGQSLEHEVTREMLATQA